MCTLTWTGGRGGYDLFFNRDELNTRAPEQPPTLAQRDGVKYVAPRDGDYGGTWLLANEFGLTICLLNDYVAAWRPSAAAIRLSRGHVVLGCATAPDHAGVIDALQRQPLERSAAFQLVAFSPEESPLVLNWNGVTLVPRAPSACVPPLSSSSFETSEVIARRSARFHTMVRSPLQPSVEELTTYHRQHERDDGAYSVLMRRPDAATRSITGVSVRRGNVGLHYEPVHWELQRAVMLAPTQVNLPLRRRTTLVV